MKKYMLLAAAASLATVPLAYAQQDPPGSRDPGPPSRHVELAPKDQSFVKKAQVGNLFEIQSSEVAQDKAQNDELKEFAEQMIEDHGKASKQLVDLADKLGTAAPNALDAQHIKKLQDLKAVPEARFDQAYLKAQSEAHQQAITLFSGYSKSGGNEQLKSWASETLPTLREHKRHLDRVMQQATAQGAEPSGTGRSAAEPAAR